MKRFRELSDEARQAKDYGAATRAWREACLMTGLYPDVRLRVVHDVNVPALTDAEWIALAQLRHQVRAPDSARVVDADVIAALLAADAKRDTET